MNPKISWRVLWFKEKDNVRLHVSSNCYSVDGSCGDAAGSYAGNSNIESGIIIGAGHKYLE